MAWSPYIGMDEVKTFVVCKKRRFYDVFFLAAQRFFMPAEIFFLAAALNLLPRGLP